MKVIPTDWLKQTNTCIGMKEDDRGGGHFSIINRHHFFYWMGEDNHSYILPRKSQDGKYKMIDDIFLLFYERETDLGKWKIVYAPAYCV